MRACLFTPQTIRKPAIIERALQPIAQMEQQKHNSMPSNNSSASADFLTHLEELAEDVVDDPHSRRVVTSEN